MEEEIRVWNKPGNLCLPWKKKLGFENKAGNLCLPWKKKLGFEISQEIFVCHGARN